jgi:hypothetical protein
MLDDEVYESGGGRTKGESTLVRDWLRAVLKNMVNGSFNGKV